MLYMCTKFHDYISNGFKVIQQTGLSYEHFQRAIGGGGGGGGKIDVPTIGVKGLYLMLFSFVWIRSCSLLFRE